MIFKDKVTIVTGAARGIGKEIAYSFAKQGSDMAICDVNQDALLETQKDLEAFGISCLTSVIDVTNYTQVQEFTDKILDKFNKIDILINNAGVTADNLMLRMKEDEWDKVLNINLKGTFNVTKAVSRHMIKQRSGKIVNIASIIGIIGNAGQVNYAASKAGVIALTKSIAKEVASRGICVNAVAPGFIRTAMTDKLSEDVKQKMLSMIPINRFGEPQDVAKVCMFLASSSSDYITGQTIIVDGGMVMIN
ncbi:MAG: 3-oxoacyl-[acyl-carrier-protein] reductase [Candidatus Omnitrophota bacterium]